MEQWFRDKLPHDLIDQLVVEEDANSHLVSNQAFGAVKHKSRRDPVWKDLQLDKLLDDDKTWWENVKDQTVLKNLDKASHSANPEPQEQDASEQGEAVGSSSSLMNKVNSTGTEITTPEMMRNRGPQRSNQNYQTPISRILR
jgi:hypothetical protein